MNWMSIEQYAEYAGWSADVIEQWVREGLPAFGSRTKKRIYVADADQWVREHKRYTPTPVPTGAVSRHAGRIG